MNIFGGIDPGLKGYISVLTSNNNKISTTFYPIPIEKEKNKNKINIKQLINILKSYSFNLIYLENIHAMPGQGVVSMFNFGLGFGIIQGILTSLEYPFLLISPIAWKNKIKIYSDNMTNKESSIIAAQNIIKANKLKVNLPLHPRTKEPFDGATDAFCLSYLAYLDFKNKKRWDFTHPENIP